MIKHLFKLVWNRKRINFLITLEVFLSFLVVFAVIIFAVYYTDNYRRPLGFDYQNVWNIGVERRAGSGDKDLPQHLETSRRLMAALREFGEIECAAGVWGAPYSNANWTSGRDDKKTGKSFEFGVNTVTDDLKDVLGLQIVRGRWFGKEDDGASYKPVVINRKLARDLFGDEDPIGKDMSNPEDKERVEERVIGLIDDFRKNGEFAALSGYAISRNDLTFKSGAQPPSSLLIKVRPGTTAAFEEKLLARLQPEARDWSFNIKPLVEMRASVFQKYLVPIAAFGLVAGFLLIMVGLGLTGVLWLNVTQRTKEIGLRRAKGATRRRIYKQILGELFIVTTIGLLVGVLIVVQFPLLDLLGFASPEVYTASIFISLGLIYLLTTVCGLYPSLLATRIHPAEALHYE
ncbi:MAG TPA: FtsX-like permease family protein [Blastocatellia bacterium]|nr:FtsX-like permease family protein [Blastocatellia bacterium]